MIRSAELRNPPWPAPFRRLARAFLHGWRQTGDRSRLTLFGRRSTRFPASPIDRCGCRLFNGMTMVCDTREHIQRQIYYFGAYEPIEAYLFSRLLRQGLCVIDAGANVGQYTLLAAGAVGSGGQVHSFEPVPKNHQQLLEHLAINHVEARVHANPVCLWDRQTTLNLHLDAVDAEDNATNYSVTDHGATVVSIECQAETLDAYAVREHLPSVDLIKMDIEGAELFALRGAIGLLESSRPILLIEINRAHANAMAYEPEAIWDLLRPLGYQIRRIGHSAADSHPIQSLQGIDRANVLLHARPLPEGLWEGWTYKSILKSLERFDPAEKA